MMHGQDHDVEITIWLMPGHGPIVKPRASMVHPKQISHRPCKR